MQDHSELEVLPLTGREADPVVISIIRHAIGNPDTDKVSSVSQMYKDKPSCHLWGISSHGELISVLGVEELSATEMRILHIATQMGYRNRGYGSSLLRHVFTESINTLWAESSQDAIEFYEQNGFEIESIGERWPGVERFRCTLRR